MTAIKCSVQEGGDLGKRIMAYDTEVFERGSTEIKVSLSVTQSLRTWDAFINSPIAKDIGLSRLHPKN